MEEEKLHKRSPITWVPTAYFAMGLPFVVLNMVTVLMFKGLGVEDKLITFWTSLILLPWTDTEAIVESVPRTVQDKEILRGRHPSDYRHYLRAGGILVELATLL